MNSKTKYLLEKLISCVCLFVAAALFFSGWISVRSNDYTKALKSELRELDEELEELEEECEEMQDELDDMDIDVSVEGLYKSVEKLYHTVKDLALSPKEIVGILPMINRLGNMMEEIEDNDLGTYFMPSEMREFVELFEEAKAVLVVLMILFVVAIAVEILYIVLHIMGKKNAGYATIALQAVWLLIGAFPVAMLNAISKEELGMKFFKLTPAPFFALVLVIVACVVWNMAYKAQAALGIQETNIGNVSLNMEQLKGATSGLKGAVSTLGGKVSDMTGKVMSQTAAETITCPKCGKQCAKGTMFCAGCGNKLEQQEAKAFCMNCGKEISATATFCNHCGAKVE